MKTNESNAVPLLVLILVAFAFWAVPKILDAPTSYGAGVGATP